jgi:hypothetical protein
MGAKFESKTHLLYTFLIFGAVFLRFASKFENSTNMTKKTIFFQIKKDKSFNQNKFDEHE